MMEVVRTVQGVDTQGSVSGWDLGTRFPQKASEGLYPPSFHRQGKGMKDMGTISSRLGIQITAEQWQPPSGPPPAKAPSKMSPQVLLLWVSASC